MNRAPISDAIEWIDRHGSRCGCEEISVDNAAGRILESPFISERDMPSGAIAVTDGFALRSADTIGASSYNPLPFRCQEDDRALEASSAAFISSGNSLPPGADAIADFDGSRASTDTIELIEPVTPGAGVNLRGQEAKAGTPLIDGVRPLRPADLALLATFGVASVSVVRRPRVRLILAGSKRTQEGDRGDANGPMLCALIARDGGTIESCTYGIDEPGAISKLIAHAGVDVVLVCGRTGKGQDDLAPRALEAVGALVLYGIALRPGESTGIGSVGGIPVILLPGNPLHCLCAYDLLAGRLIREMGGRASNLPYRTQFAAVGRKIVSSIGNTEFCWVRLVNGEVIPLGSAGSGGLVSAARADGFVVVPAASEGYGPGASVAVYLCGDEIRKGSCE